MEENPEILQESKIWRHPLLGTRTHGHLRHNANLPGSGNNFRVLWSRRKKRLQQREQKTWQKNAKRRVQRHKKDQENQDENASSK